MVVVLLLVVGCQEPRRVPVAIDLTRFRFGDVNGRPMPLRVRPGDGEPRLVVGPDQTVDLSLILPAAATLRLRSKAFVAPEAIAVSVQIDDGWYPLAFRRIERNVFWAALPPGEGRHARIRFQVRGRKRLTWTRARVVGREQQRAPALAPATRPPAGAPVNVIVYLVDALRADHLSLYGYARETTPRLTALTRRGAVVFENAYAAGPNTANSIPAFFTSRLASELGANFMDARGAARTMAEAFAAARYDTGAFTVNPLLAPAFGYGRGFATYRLLRLPEQAPVKCCPSTRVIQAAASAWMARRRSGPFFLYVHTLDVHHYAPSPPFLDRFAGDGRRREPEVPRRMRPPGALSLGELFRRRPENAAAITPDRYDEAIASVDADFARFVEALGPLRDRTIIVFTADHGEALGNEDDGSYMHGQSLHEEQVRVPLVMLVPWLGRVARVDEIVSLLDVAPTLADLSEVSIAPSWQGRSLLRPTGMTKPPAAVFERLGRIGGGEPALAPGIFRVASCGIREGPWKLIVDPDGAELFDLRVDPKETHDVHGVDPWVTSVLANRTWERSPALRAVGFRSEETLPKRGEAPPVVRRKIRQALEALGYVE